MDALAVKAEIAQHKLGLSEMLNRFVQYVDVSQASIRTYVFGVKSFLQYLSDKGIRTPTRETVLMYKKDLAQSKSASTIALYLTAIRRFFAWCESENLYSDITRGIKSPRQERGHKRDAFSVKQIREIIGGISRESLKGKRDYALFCLLSATGLRTIEAMRADIGDMREIQGQTCLFIQGKGKTSKSDFVKLSGHVVAAIGEYLKARGPVSEDEPLFASCSRRNTNQRMTTRSISRLCKMAMIQAGYNTSRLTAHSLRHTAITLALIAGVSLQEVSQFARHSNISITMIYAHDVERLKSQCENAISNALFGA